MTAAWVVGLRCRIIIDETAIIMHNVIAVNAFFFVQNVFCVTVLSFESGHKYNVGFFLSALLKRQLDHQASIL